MGINHSLVSLIIDFGYFFIVAFLVL